MLKFRPNVKFVEEMLPQYSRITKGEDTLGKLQSSFKYTRKTSQYPCIRLKIEPKHIEMLQ